MHYKVSRSNLLKVGLLSLLLVPALSPAQLFAESARLLFKSGFESGVSIKEPNDYNVIGKDSVSGFEWPTDLPGLNANNFIYYETKSYHTLSDYQATTIGSVTGHDGQSTKAMHMNLKKRVTAETNLQNRIQYQWRPDNDSSDPQERLEEMYISYWIKMNFDDTKSWRNLAEMRFKSGDYRWALYIRDIRGTPYWELDAQRGVAGDSPFDWLYHNKDVSVPQNQWFKLELYWKHSAGDDGRIWVAIDGTTLFDHHGRTMRANPVAVFNPFKVYGTLGEAWYDDIEIWDNIPSDEDRTTLAPIKSDLPPSDQKSETEYFIIAPGTLSRP